MAYKLPPLPYAYDALEPFLDKQTMHIHHQNHHATYISKLNNAIKGTEFENIDIPTLLGRLYKIPKTIRGTLRNSGGGHINHSLFWKMMSPQGGGAPNGELATAIDRGFGDFKHFQKTFCEIALAHSGSGWAWLVQKLDAKLHIYSTPNQDNPFMQTGDMPLLGLDLWEHAYYLKYKNNRADYIKNWWNIVSWRTVDQRYKFAQETTA